MSFMRKLQVRAMLDLLSNIIVTDLFQYKRLSIISCDLSTAFPASFQNVPRVH